MADQVKSPKSIGTRSRRSIVDTTVAILGDLHLLGQLPFFFIMEIFHVVKFNLQVSLPTLFWSILLNS